MYFDSNDSLCTYLESRPLKDTEKLMLMVGEASADTLPQLRETLNKKGITYFGGIYAQLLVGEKHLSEGAIAFIVEPLYCGLVLPHMMRLKQSPESFKGCTAITLVDGLSSDMKVLTETVYRKLGDHVQYLGGGAGFYDLKHRPCLFDEKGMYEDVLYLCIVKADVKLAVKHGWTKLIGPFTVTRSVDNVLSEIDGQPAFDIYREALEDAEDILLSKEEFFRYAKEHPFGILQDDDSVIVRDPISVTDDRAIICVANIPEQKEVYVLSGDVNTLLASSQDIAAYCAEHQPDTYHLLLFDCISRAMFLEEKFKQELSNIQCSLNEMLYGALSIGEIASSYSGELVIHNKSTIIGLLER